MTDAAPDPYTVRQGEAHSPPSNFAGRIRYLGPSLIVTGAVIGRALYEGTIDLAEARRLVNDKTRSP